MDILKNNELISKFMGLKKVLWPSEYGDEWVWVQNDFVENFSDVHNYGEDSKFDWANSLPQSYELYYHSSWDWLMPVIEKIEGLGYGVTIYRKGCQINDIFITCLPGFNNKSKIEETYKAVIEFIKLYK